MNILIDIEFITEVCDNLTANAARYADKTVAIDFAWENDGLLLSVSDDGKGFGQDMLQKAADPYFTEEKDRAEHFGLGLYICKLLCERHGGFLRIENIPKGARVTAFFKSLSN